MEEDHEEWIKNSNTEFGYRDALEDERKADKGKTNFCQVDTVDDQGRRTKSTLTWDEDGESKSETVLL